MGTIKKGVQSAADKKNATETDTKTIAIQGRSLVQCGSLESAVNSTTMMTRRSRVAQEATNQAFYIMTETQLR